MNTERPDYNPDLELFDSRFSNWLEVGFWLLISQKGIGDKKLAEGIKINYLKEYDKMVEGYLAKVKKSLNQFKVIHASTELEALYRKREVTNSENVNEEIKELALKYNKDISEKALQDLIASISGDHQEIRGPADNAKHRVKLIFPDINSGKAFIRKNKKHVIQMRALAKEYTEAFDFLENKLGSAMLLFVETANLDENQTQDFINYAISQKWIHLKDTIPEEK